MTLASAVPEARVVSAKIDANAAAAVFGRRGHTPDHTLAIHHQCSQENSIVVLRDCLLVTERLLTAESAIYSPVHYKI